MSPWRKHLESISTDLGFAGNTIAMYRPFQFLVLVNLLFTCSSCFLLGAGIRVPNGLFLQSVLTSLEQLSIQFDGWYKASRRLVKELGSLRELRVLDASIPWENEMERDLIESVHRLHKLQHLKIGTIRHRCLDRRPEMEFVLRGDLRYLALPYFVLWKLPSCIDPLCHRKLSHLELCLLHMDEQDLKTLGRLPELRFLVLALGSSSATIRNISDSDACYFPKLRCFKLRSSLAVFIANKGNNGKKTVSFHIWDGMPPSVFDSKLLGDDEFSSDDVPPVSDEEKKEGSISIREGEGEGAATPRFMPSLQVLHFLVREQAVRDPVTVTNSACNSSLRSGKSAFVSKDLSVPATCL